MNILLAGQKWFGSAVFSALNGIDAVNISAVCAPFGGEKEDRLYTVAKKNGVPLIPAGQLREQTMPNDIDLIVAAHSHDFIGQKTRLRARYGGIGYHPSLLPLHRGRDAVRWAIRMRERVTGGTVYRLSNRVDGGDILAQRHIFISPNDTAEDLWRGKLAPLGVELLTETVGKFSSGGYIIGTPQEEDLATWEPSIDRQPIYKPDLYLLSFLY